MRRFLELVEEYDPVQGESPKWKLIDFLKSKGINVSLVKDTDMLYIDTGESTIPVNVQISDGEEDESTLAGDNPYDVDKEVENLSDKANRGLKGLAAKALGASAQRAKSAVKKRENLAKKAVGAYEKKTNNLERQLRNVQ